MSAVGGLLGGNALVALLSFAFGWVLLWPARHALRGAYHLLALLAGLLLWPMLVLTNQLAGSAFAVWPVALGALWLLAIAWGTIGVNARAGRIRGGGEQETQQPRSLALRPAGFAIAGAIAAAATLLAATVRLTAVGYDSVFHYALAAMTLLDTARITRAIAGGYGTLVPGIHAAVLALGESWTFAIYPLLALTLLGLLGYALWRWALAALPPAKRAAAVAISVALLATVPAFVFHAFYVHTQMISAAYLLASLLALRAAEDTTTARDRRALLAVAGLLAAGLAAGRPDGLAYAFVPALVASVPSIAHGRPRDAGAFLGPFALVAGSAYAPAFATLGLWGGDKLTGAHALGAIAAWALAALAWVLVDRAVARGHRPLSVATLRTAAYAALALGLIAVAVVRPEGLATALRNGAVNLFATGGYGLLWYALAGMLALTLAMPSARRRGDWSATLLLATSAFFGIALAVHGATHPGRLAVADSFNRVAFHAVPVVMWYVGSFLGGALAQLAEDGALGKDDA